MGQAWPPQVTKRVRRATRAQGGERRPHWPGSSSGGRSWGCRLLWECGPKNQLNQGEQPETQLSALAPWAPCTTHKAMFAVQPATWAAGSPSAPG